MSNNYLVVEIEDDIVSWIPNYLGIITGSGYFTSGEMSNCYYKAFQTTLPLTSENCTLSNISSFVGEGTTWTLNTPPYISGAYYSDLVEALNAWVDANNEDGKYRHWVADTENVNGGFPIFDPYDSPATTVENVSGENTIPPTQKLLFNNQILIRRGEKVYTIDGQEVR